MDGIVRMECKTVRNRRWRGSAGRSTNISLFVIRRKTYVALCPFYLRDQQLLEKPFCPFGGSFELARRSLSREGVSILAVLWPERFRAVLHLRRLLFAFNCDSTTLSRQMFTSVTIVTAEPPSKTSFALSPLRIAEKQGSSGYDDCWQPHIQNGCFLLRRKAYRILRATLFHPLYWVDAPKSFHRLASTR